MLYAKNCVKFISIYSLWNMESKIIAFEELYRIDIKCSIRMKSFEGIHFPDFLALVFIELHTHHLHFDFYLQLDLI